ncbi:MAG: DUF2905 domain-containing protein [Deltaproteobacteria bacterium]|nr:DUF2905 domain-containing protein [Deltaproteobacteria bacterium]
MSNHATGKGFRFVSISRPGVKIYIPIGTMILVSVIVSVILWLLRK